MPSLTGKSVLEFAGSFRSRDPFIVVYLGYIGIMEGKNGNYYIRIRYMLGLYWGYIGIMENEMETTIL